MLGDLVMYRGESYRVTILSENGNIGITDKRDATRIVQCKDLKCIPVTPEILEANGFVPEEDNTLTCWTETTFIDFGKDDGKYFSANDEKWCSGKLEYVHELQHMIRLLKIDKEITL